MNYLIVFLLVILSGLFSGLTLGLLRLDKAELKRKISLKDKQAKKVYSVRRDGNLLLCTLLLGNVAVNSALAIFLGDIASGFIAGISATGLILLFGEIIPQATFARYALQVGSKTVWIVKIFIFIFYPICKPIAWTLDRVLGEELPTVYSKKELIKIIEEHEHSSASDVDKDEKRIIKGALSFSEKTVEQIMTPRSKVYCLQEKMILDKKLINIIKKKGHTRIPVYNKNVRYIVGVLYVKDLLGMKIGISVASIFRQDRVLRVHEGMKLDELLNDFLQDRLHMAIVEDRVGKFIGVTTLEDVIEEVLKTEIVDETDKNI